MNEHRLCLIHPVDPRSGASGLAARLGRIMARRPEDFSILLVGVDECGDLDLGRPTRLEAEGLPFDFLPVLRARRSGWSHGAEANQTLRLAFRFAFMLRLASVRRESEGELASTELHDLAWAPLARMLGHPVVQVMQSESCAPAVAPGVVGEYLALHFASRIVGDEESIRRLRQRNARIAGKTEVLRLSAPPLVDDVEPICSEEQIERLYERHRRLFRVGRAGAVRPAVA